MSTSSSEGELWPLLAYADSFSVVTGETLRVFVSSVPATFDAEIVRLGMPGRSGLEEHVESSVEGSYPGRVQALHAGSYVHTQPIANLAGRSFTVQAWIWPTLAGDGVQTILAQGRPGHTGWSFELDEYGRLRLREWSLGAEGVRLQSTVRLASHFWYFVAGVIDLKRSLGRLRVAAASPWMSGRYCASEEADLAEWTPGESNAEAKASVYIAASQAEQHGTWATAIFNGKIDSPRLFGAALTESQLDLIAGDADPAEVARGKLAGAWDMSVAMDSACVIDRSPAVAHGTCVNLPTRAVPGHRWAGQALSPREAPGLYGAMHFHDDDMADAGWSPDLELPIRSDLRSGLYAVKLTNQEARAYVPFYVRPRIGAPSAPALFLAPTNSYLAYANNRLAITDLEWVAAREEPLSGIDSFVVNQDALGGSLYDRHNDGSGICYASARRPMPNIDPTYIDPTGRPRHFAADLGLLRWLAMQDQGVDVATDQDLHRDGLALLRSYRVVLTGSHPEYWTAEMLDALQDYLRGGGSVMYLGGNGFYWVTSFHRELPHVIEVRRGFAGTRTWESGAGEEHHSTTGERGGLWRHRGRAPNALVGVGCVGHGVGRGVGYQRLPASYEPQHSFIFEGVEGERFGDFGPALMGAAGDEVDATNLTLGTAPDAAVLARSGTLVGYRPTQEEELVYMPDRCGEHNPRIRSELVYFETGHGGAVFSVSSINWCAALAQDDYDNDVARITGNVLTAFLER